MSPTSARALEEGAREATFRGTRLEVIHVVDSLDQDIAAANQAGISDAVEKALTAAGLASVEWSLHLVAGGTEIADVAGAIPRARPRRHAGPARHRCPASLSGREAFLGSVAQDLVLGSEVPFLVVKGGQAAGVAVFS